MTTLLFKRRAQDRFQDWLRDYPRATPIAVFCVALLLVITAARSVEMAERRTWLAGQQALADDIASRLERKAASDSAYLVTMSSLFANVVAPSPQTFSAYISRLRVIENLSGVVGVGWIDAVDRANLPALEARLGSANFRSLDLANAEGGEQSTYIVSMLEPQTAENRRLIGFDMHSEGRRAVTLDRGRRSGAVTASDNIQLTQDANKAPEPSFLVVAPVRSATEKNRFLGFVYLPVRTRDFVKSAVRPQLLATGKVELVDQTPQGAETIFSSGPKGINLGTALEEKIEIFDQQWTLRYAPPAREGFYPLSLVVLFGGSAFSTLLLAYVLLVQRRNGDLHALLDAQLVQEKERAAFIRELNHRVKNTLANVTSMIALSRYRTDDVQVFADTLLHRVKALAAGHSLLDGQQWGPTDLRAIIATQLSAHDSGDRIDIDGPEVMISPNDALTIGLAVHELATNASRFGALSADEGHVKVHWNIVDEDWVEVDWQEEGGPPVVEPARLGLGLNLVQRALAHELRRPIEIDFDPAGLHCHFYVQRRVPKSFQLRR